LGQKEPVTDGLGELLDAGGYVDGVTDQGELEFACAANRSGEHVVVLLLLATMANASIRRCSSSG